MKLYNREGKDEMREIYLSKKSIEFVPYKIYIGICSHSWDMYKLCKTHQGKWIWFSLNNSIGNTIDDEFKYSMLTITSLCDYVLIFDNANEFADWMPKYYKYITELNQDNYKKYIGKEVKNEHYSNHALPGKNILIDYKNGVWYFKGTMLGNPWEEWEYPNLNYGKESDKGNMRVFYIDENIKDLLK